MTGVSLLIPGAAPTPSSTAWWWSRPLMFVAAIAAVLALSLLVGRWEALGELGRTPSPAAVAVGWLLAVVPPFAVMQWFLDVWLAVGGAVLLAVAVPLLRGRHRVASET